MLRYWLGEVGEWDGSGMWRTEWGVGIGVVETDIPRSDDGVGRVWVEAALPLTARDA
jgi:hypothetical protein